MSAILMILAAANLLTASINVHEKNYGVATFTFGAFLLALTLLIKLT